MKDKNLGEEHRNTTDAGNSADRNYGGEWAKKYLDLADRALEHPANNDSNETKRRQDAG